MQTYGARCVASPSNETDSGKAILAKDPNNTGSLGIAISEAAEMAAKNPDTKYALGGVVKHVLMNKTIDGNEALIQMEKAYKSRSQFATIIGHNEVNHNSIQIKLLRQELSQDEINKKDIVNFITQHGS